ncbi:uncharacterized protein LOC116850171, partial [Odontomachus brunneus]|uniref:uncharacterized protein LOC116850171 n=1 Tax=Odontomachus brunneus TaxID=486640 RepID=UPI0013F2B03A
MPTTKRSILSAIARLYDSLGWVTPVVLAAKVIIQLLWRLKVSWDERVPDTILQRWQLIYAGIPRLNELYIPRWSGLTSTARIELHGFADASNVAYAAVVYARVTTASEKIVITLLQGKSRVAPLKTQSVPRLELLGATLLARLLEFVRSELNLTGAPCVCWSDSTIVLAWLRQHPSRVAEVQGRLPGVEWRHIATADNPADCASRGLLGGELVSHPLWWQGPSWLMLSSDLWPTDSEELPADAPLETKKHSLLINRTTKSWDLAEKFSSWPKLIRVTAYVLKFVSCCRRSAVATDSGRVPGITLSAREFDDSRFFWLKQTQRELFASELRELSQGRGLPSRSSLLSLGPFIDNEGLLRVGGRLQNAANVLTSRHPILLAAHPLVTLIIRHTHLRALHAGLQLTLSTLCREYWVLRARTIVKSIIHRCVACARERAAVPTQLMGSLPITRVTAPSRSFLHCGIDYAGPVAVRASADRGIKSIKAYIALFVCLASRAVHLELVSDYSTAAFLNAFARFCARRGLPQSVYSDNGTNFAGANRELHLAYRTALRDPDLQGRLASDKIDWHFIPPSTPHSGGIWEAGVKSVKHHLRRVLGDHTLSFEEFSTLLCKIEACLNSRPIAPLSDTIDDCDSLTPVHFLIGSAITTPPEPSVLDLRANRISRWQLLHQLTERFWRRYNDYVNTLNQR